MTEKHKNVCATLNYIEQFFIASTFPGCTLISAFGSLISIPIGIISSVIGLPVLY